MKERMKMSKNKFLMKMGKLAFHQSVFEIQQTFGSSSPVNIMMLVLILLRNDQKIKSYRYTCNQLNQIYTFIKHKLYSQ